MDFKKLMYAESYLAWNRNCSFIDFVFDTSEILETKQKKRQGNKRNGRIFNIGSRHNEGKRPRKIF